MCDGVHLLCTRLGLDRSFWLRLWCSHAVSTESIHCTSRTCAFRHLSDSRIHLIQGGGQARIREIKRREQAEPNKTLFVVNFEPQSTEMDDLRHFFEQWGELERVQLKTKFAFVEVLATSCTMA
jgi:hypothetical protein